MMFMLLLSAQAAPVVLPSHVADLYCPSPCRVQCEKVVGSDPNTTQSTTVRSCQAGCDAPKSSLANADGIDEYCHSLPSGKVWDFDSCVAGAQHVSDCERQAQCTRKCESAPCNRHASDKVAHLSCVRGCHAPSFEPDALDEYCHTLNLPFGASFQACKEGATAQLKCMTSS